MQAMRSPPVSTLFEAMQDAASITAYRRAPANSARAFVELVNRWREMAAGRGVGRIFCRAEGPVQLLMEDVVRRSGLEAFYKKEGGGSRRVGQHRPADYQPPRSSTTRMPRDAG